MDVNYKNAALHVVLIKKRYNFKIVLDTQTTVK